MARLLLSFAIHAYSSILELSRHTLLPMLSRGRRFETWDLKLRSSVPLREKQPLHSPVVWIHAASLGEAKLTGRFLAIVEKQGLSSRYVLTATTRAGLGCLRKITLPSVLAAALLPLDSIPLMDKMLRRFNVSRVWLMETELWPAMLWVCRKRNIPVGVVNARMERKSFGQYKMFAGLLRPLLRHLDPVLAQTQEYADRFQALGVPPHAIHVAGNLKSYVPIAPMPNAERDRRRRDLNLPDDALVVTAGCIHPGEGALVRRAIDQVRSKGLPVRLIAIPRHLRAVPELLEELGPDALHLTAMETAAEWQTCLIAKLGVLEHMYGIADIAFVGGTFVSVGGHNMWDAARFGMRVLFGPDFHTQQDSCRTLIDSGVGCSVSDAEDLARRIEEHCRDGKDTLQKALHHLADVVGDRQKPLQELLS